MIKHKIFQLAVVALAALFATGCAVIREGEIGVKSKLGKFDREPYTQGVKAYNPFTSRILKISTQTENMEVGLSIPSKEGLNILSEVSILYRIMPEEAVNILRNIGPDYERNIIMPVFRSAVADVTSRYYARDMHTGERTTIEKAIEEQMMLTLREKGIEVEQVLLKSIQLPQSLARAIEAKLEADQQAQQMEFVLEQEKRKADQRRIEAEGIRDAQSIISEGLNAKILQFKSIEAFMELAKSPNAKIIVTDGDLPVLMNSELDPESINTNQTRVRTSNRN